MDQSRVRALIQYILLTAGESASRFERELGPIHILKYLYLADLAWAADHGGATWTGIPWRFHHFGPWDEDSWMEIEPTIRTAGGTIRRFESSISQDDVVRYSLVDSDQLARLSREVPLLLRTSVRGAVRAHGADTSALLHEVYMTSPMRNAAPGEYLDFDAAVQVQEDTVESSTEGSSLSHKERLRRKKLQADVGARARAALEGKRQDRAAKAAAMSSERAPRYDDVWEQGSAWLDSLAGEPVPEGEGQFAIAEGIWHSQARRTGFVP